MASAEIRGSWASQWGLGTLGVLIIRYILLYLGAPPPKKKKKKIGLVLCRAPLLGGSAASGLGTTRGFLQPQIFCPDPGPLPGLGFRVQGFRGLGV